MAYAYADVLRVARQTMRQLHVQMPVTPDHLAARLSTHIGMPIVLEPSGEIGRLNASGITARDNHRYLVQYDAAATVRRRSLILFHELAHIILDHPLAVIDHSGAQRPGGSADFTLNDNATPVAAADRPVAPPDIDPELIDPGAVAAVRGHGPSGPGQADAVAGHVQSTRGLWKPGVAAGQGASSGLPPNRDGDETGYRLASVYSTPAEWEAETFAAICLRWSTRATGGRLMMNADSLVRALSVDGMV